MVCVCYVAARASIARPWLAAVVACWIARCAVLVHIHSVSHSVPLVTGRLASADLHSSGRCGVRLQNLEICSELVAVDTLRVPTACAIKARIIAHVADSVRVICIIVHIASALAFSDGRI